MAKRVTQNVAVNLEWSNAYERLHTEIKRLAYCLHLAPSDPARQEATRRHNEALVGYSRASEKLSAPDHMGAGR